MPKFEILITTYNRLQYLKLALESALNQEFDDYCVTVVNSASNDGTKEYLDSLDDRKVKVHHFENNLGIVGNIARGLRLISCEYAVLFHDDDVLKPSFLEVYSKETIGKNDVVLFHCAADIIGSKGEKKGKSDLAGSGAFFIDTEEYPRVYFNNRKRASILMPSVMINMRLIEDRNKFFSLNNELTMLVDVGLWMRLSCLGRFYYIDQVLINYRVHDSQGTSSFSKSIGTMRNNRVALEREVETLFDDEKLSIQASKYTDKSMVFDLYKCKVLSNISIFPELVKTIGSRPTLLKSPKNLAKLILILLTPSSLLGKSKDV